MVDEPIVLSEHREEWQEQAIAEIRRLADALARPRNVFEHIGSTAVPELVAKPTIDLMLGITVLPPGDQLVRAIESLGYSAHGQAGVPNRWYFTRRQGASFNLHLVEIHGLHWRNNLAIRDYLRLDPEARHQYGQAKRALQEGHDTLLAYSERKADVVRQLISAANARRL
jgi:GrpB-like predicted nucleotidyltransferase (UPF0157 family)